MKVREHPLRDVARIAVYYGMPQLVRLLPAGMEFKFYRFLGRLYALIARGKVRHLKNNLLKILPFENEQQVDKVVRGYIENHFVDRLQLFSFPRLSAKNIDKYLRIDNLDKLKESLAKGQGCVIIHGHFGPAQLFIAAIALAGYPITQLGYISREGYSYIGEKVAVRKRLELEAQIPGKIFYTDQFLRPIFQKLKNNEVISNAGDGTLLRDHVGKLVPVAFLGETRPFPIGSVTLAQHSKAELLPLFISKLPGKNYSGRFGRPIKIEPGAEGVGQAVQEFANMLAGEIANSPELWHFWDEFPEVARPTAAASITNQ